MQVREYEEEMYLTELDKLEQRVYGEIGAGQTPDLLVMNEAAEAFYLDLAGNGHLADLSDLQDILTGSVRSALQTKDTLFRIPMGVQYTTLVSAESQALTLDSLLTAAGKANAENPLFSVNQIRNLLKVIQHSFVDSAARTCDFEGEAFRQYLMLLDRMQTVTDTDLGSFLFNGSYSADHPDLPENVMAGKVRYAEMPLYTIEGIGAMKLFFEDADVHMCGFPDTPAILQIPFSYCVLEDGQCTAGAMMFLQYMLSDKVQVSYPVTERSLPVTSSGVDILLKDTWYQFMLREGKDLLNPAAETVHITFFMKFWREEDVVPFGNLGKEVVYTEADKAAFKALTEDETVIRMADPAIDAILQEEIGAFLSGDRTMDDTIRVLQSRVGTYLAE